MTVTDDLRFAFDVQGYLHLRGIVTAEELAEYREWIEQVRETDPQVLNEDAPEGISKQLNRPLSRVIDADPRFGRFLDHPAVEPFLVEFLGEGYRHIDNDLYFTYPGYAGGHWHRGVRAHSTGYVRGGKFTCTMVKVFYCMTDVGPGQGEFVVVPGSHRTQFHIDMHRVDLPAQHIFDDVQAGDLIIFNEALLHNGRPNPSDKMRQTIIMNFGREDAGIWSGYTPRPETLAAVSPRQREILANEVPTWKEPELVEA
jgi:ectoine hydroxylase-related dioxygenase (phytanoyl-CoA dioxygenase family)